MFSKPVLVTGATGYVGGRLIPLMLGSGYRVRALARSLAKLGSRPWSGHPHMAAAATEAGLERIIYLSGLGDSHSAALSGLMGILYWYLFYPFHEMIFSGMLRAIARAVGQPIVSGPERFIRRLS